MKSSYSPTYLVVAIVLSFSTNVIKSMFEKDIKVARAWNIKSTTIDEVCNKADSVK